MAEETPVVGTTTPAESPSTLAEITAPAEPGPADAGLLDFFDPGALPLALAVLAGTAVVLRTVRRSADALAAKRVERRLAIKQGMTLAEATAYAIATVIAVSMVLDLSAEAVLALSGTLALAGGFILKDLGESVVAGISILVSRPFHVGDRITFGGYYGEVQEIGLRSVRLVTLDDNLVTIPCSKILSEPVASANAGQLACMVVVPFYLAAHADHARAREIVQDAVLSSRFLDLARSRTVLTQLEMHDGVGTVIVLTAKAYVFDTLHERDFASDVTDRVLRAFRTEAIPLASADATPHPPAVSPRAA